MTVDQLRKVLEDLPGELPVLISSVDHSYRPVDFALDSARYVRSEGYYCEDSGDDADHRPEEKVIQAVIGY